MGTSGTGFSLDPRHVEGTVFTETGKYKYTVCLDYTGGDFETWDLWTEAKNALRRATKAGTSGVTFAEIHPGWHLVVLEPYGKTGHPIMVTGTL
jgi:hypothetical protein